MSRNNNYEILWILLFIIHTCLTQVRPLSAEGERDDPFKIPYSLKDRLRQLTLEKEDIDKKDALSMQLPALNIEGIMWGGAHPNAIINGQIVKIGDRVGDAIIKDISKNGVIISYQGLDFILHLTGGMSEWKSKLK